jgi:hypothetical protein
MKAKCSEREEHFGVFQKEAKFIYFEKFSGYN